jgi:hypothetical protein
MNPDYSAEIERMMGGAGSELTPGAPPQESPPPGQIPNPAIGEHGYPATGGIPESARPPQEDPQLVAMRDQLRAAQEEIGALKARTPLPTSTGEVQQAPPQNVDQIKRQLEESFLKDPGGTLLAMAGYMQGETQKMIDASITKGNAGIRADLSGGNIDAFRAKMAADPVLSPALPEFDRLIKDVGDKLTPGNMSKELDALASTALGNTLRTRLPGSRQQQPPAWGGGLTASADSGQPASAPTAKLSTEQEEYVRTMIDMGLPKEVIADRLKNWDFEGGFSKP